MAHVDEKMGNIYGLSTSVPMFFLNMKRRQRWYMFATILFASLLIFHYRDVSSTLRTPADYNPWPAAHVAEKPAFSESQTSCHHPDVAFLRELVGEDVESIQYGYREILVNDCSGVTCDGKTLDLTTPEFEEVSLADQDILGPEVCTPPFVLPLPRPQQRINAPHLIFGVATVVDRLRSSIEQFAHWAGFTGVRIFAVIEPCDYGSILDVQSRAAELGINLDITTSDLEFTDRYYSLTRVLYENRDARTEWAVFVDDDTFILSINAIVAYLAEFDTSKPHYLGGLSENMGHVQGFGIMAYGGGGIFISLPLLAEMDALYDDCSKDHIPGDMRIANCINENTNTKFLSNPSIHQLDFRGDASGFFESGRPQPLTIHHWKSWFWLNVDAMSLVSSVCGDDCLLRRWKLADGWFLNNGYSVVKYSVDIEPEDTSMERTWDMDGPFKHSLSPLRKKDESKRQFVIRGAQTDTNGTVRQYYVMDESGEKSVLEVGWRRDV